MTKRPVPIDVGKSASGGGGRPTWGRAMTQNRWQMLKPGDYAMTTWDGDAQLTYRVTRDESGRVLTRRVAGAREMLELAIRPTLQELIGIARSDAAQGL